VYKKVQMAESDQNRKKTLDTQKKITKKSESLGWDPPLPKSLDILFFLFVFPKVFTSFQRVLAGPPLPKSLEKIEINK